MYHTSYILYHAEKESLHTLHCITQIIFFYQNFDLKKSYHTDFFIGILCDTILLSIVSHKKINKYDIVLTDLSRAIDKCMELPKKTKHTTFYDNFNQNGASFTFQKKNISKKYYWCRNRSQGVLVA